jgi:hypothetical protein
MMKQKSILIGGVILLLVVLIAGGVFLWRYLQRSDIRNVRWGMSPEQVKQRETAQLVTEKSKSLLYQTLLFEHYPVALEYAFVQEELSSIRYISLKKYKSYQECLTDFLAILETIERQNGLPRTHHKEGNFQNFTWWGPLKISLTLGEADQLIWILEYQKADTS